MARNALPVVAALLFVPVAGCGQKGPELGRVLGRVTLDGAPLPEARVMFVPEQGRPATAMTSSAGAYELQFTVGRTGALLGPHEVRITTFAPARDEFTPEGEAKAVPQRPELVPDKYNAKSQLKVDVQRGANRFDFELTSK